MTCTAYVRHAAARAEAMKSKLDQIRAEVAECRSCATYRTHGAGTRCPDHERAMLDALSNVSPEPVPIRPVPIVGDVS